MKAGPMGIISIRRNQETGAYHIHMLRSHADMHAGNPTDSEYVVITRFVHALIDKDGKKLSERDCTVAEIEHYLKPSAKL